MIWHLQLPLNREILEPLRAGDQVYLNGDLFTARDAAHQRLAETHNRGEQLPISLAGATIYYTGPCPAKPGAAIGPCGPTTSMRMDTFAPLFFSLGMIAMVGKGDRTPVIRELCRSYGGVYLVTLGGAAALLAETVVASEIVAYEDLDSEAIRRLTVVDMPTFVAIDSAGNLLFESEIPKYRRA